MDKKSHADATEQAIRKKLRGTARLLVSEAEFLAPSGQGPESTTRAANVRPDLVRGQVTRRAPTKRL